jgi:hypothetical protein
MRREGSFMFMVPRPWWLCAVALSIAPARPARGAPAGLKDEARGPDAVTGDAVAGEALAGGSVAGPGAGSPSASGQRTLWGIPRFFEVGREVRLAPGAEPVDTTGWVRQALEQDWTHRRADLTATADDVSRLFVYAEGDPVSREVTRYGLVVPQGRVYSSNGRVVAYWGPSADAFNFGVGSSRSFGSLTALGPGGGPPVVRRLERQLEPAGANVQAYQLQYEIEGTALNLFEHKGLVPGIPVSFERFTVYARGAAGATSDVGADSEPVPVVPGRAPMTLEIGLVSRDAPASTWTNLESFDAPVDGEAYRVVLATDTRGDHYFLAAPLFLGPSAYFGGVASDLVVESTSPSAGSSARHQPACALFFPNASGGTVFSGKVSSRSEVPGYLRQATAFLTAHDAGLADLRAHGDRGLVFLRQYTQTFLQTHRSRRDHRVITALPYGDASYPPNPLESTGGIRYGSDQARVLLGLVGYQRKTHDPSVLDPIWGITEASMEAMTPSGAVWGSRFDDMLVAEEEDAGTGRADVFLDNGGASVGFNHQRLVIRSGSPRTAGVTWGAFSAVIDGATEAVDGGKYSFAVDGGSIPESFQGDQDALSVSRLFTRQDGKLRVRELASVARGVPAVRVHDQIENRGSAPLFVNEARMTIGDFFHYGAGRGESSQNRYGFSPVVEGVPLHVGIWMEGMDEPLWGDNFPPGWVDLTELYRKHRPRYLAVYGYDKAEIYYLPEAADRLVVYNAAEPLAGAPGPKSPLAAPLTGTGTGDGYRGWTTLQLRYKVGRRLAPGAIYRSPSVYSYLMRAPLFSVDRDTVPDALQSLVPLWTELLEISKDFTTEAALRAHLAALPDRQRARRLEGLLHTSLEPDDASIAMQAAWIESADLMAELAARATDAGQRQELERRAELTRASALRGAAYSLTAMTQLRGRFDLMPAYGIRSNYGFHVLVFDWAYRMTGDTRYRDAMLSVAGQIASSEDRGGLQITDPSKANYGAYVLNELSRAQGSNNLDDQGVKLWALRVAYERTLDQRFRRSAELFIDQWIKVRAEDHRFFGTSKLFDRYVLTGPEQQMTPLGHYGLLVGLRAWADLHPRAAALYAEGLKSVTERHPVDAIGTTGALDGDRGGARDAVHFGTGAEVGGTFLMAMTFDAARLKGRWSVRPRKREHPISARQSATGRALCLHYPPHGPG